MDDENKVLDNNPVTEPVGEQGNQGITENTEGTTTQDMVPLKTHLDMKNQMKQMKKELAKLKESQQDNESLAYRDKVIKKYTDAGYEPSLAELIADDMTDIRNLATTKKQSYIEDSIDEDIQDLAGTDEYYKDAVNYTDSIKAKIKEFKKKGVELDVSDAYALVANRSQKNRNTNIDSQREVLNNKKSGVPTGTVNVPTAGSSKTTTQFNLDADDNKALKRLQLMQPDAGWTPEKYSKMMKR